MAGFVALADVEAAPEEAKRVKSTPALKMGPEIGRDYTVPEVLETIVASTPTSEPENNPRRKPRSRRSTIGWADEKEEDNFMSNKGSMGKDGSGRKRKTSSIGSPSWGLWAQLPSTRAMRVTDDAEDDFMSSHNSVASMGSVASGRKRKNSSLGFPRWGSSATLFSLRELGLTDETENNRRASRTSGCSQTNTPNRSLVSLARLGTMVGRGLSQRSLTHHLEPLESLRKVKTLEENLAALRAAVLIITPPSRVKVPRVMKDFLEHHEYEAMARFVSRCSMTHSEIGQAS